MEDIKDLNVAWSEIDGEGLVRVIPTDSFKTGFIVLASIGKQSEAMGFYPEVLITPSKLTVTVPEDTEGRDHLLARAVDTLLDNDTDSAAKE